MGIFRFGPYQFFHPFTKRTKVEQYEKVMGENPSGLSKLGAASSRVEGLDTSKFPVESVSYYDALLFCNKLSELDNFEPVYQLSQTIRNLQKQIKSARVVISPTANGYRLPNAQLWQYCCRAGTETDFFFGNDLDDDQANFRYVSQRESKRTVDVGSFPANGFELHGNVWEWCEDLHPQNSGYLCGGGWSYPKEKSTSFSRLNAERGERAGSYGFRVVLIKEDPSRKAFNSGMRSSDRYDRIRYLTDAIEKDPGFVEAYDQRGSANSRLGEYAKAIADYESAIEIDGDYAASRNNLAWLLATCSNSEYHDGKQAIIHAKKSM